MNPLEECDKGHTYNATVTAHCPKCSVRGDL